jgi:hypothetical protein
VVIGFLVYTQGVMRLMIGLAVGLLVGATGVSAGDGGGIPARPAKALARDYLAPLVRPDTKAVNIRVLRCRDLGEWRGCRVHVIGKTRCNAVVRTRYPARIVYEGWVPKMRCR